MAKPKRRFESSMMQEAYEKGYLSPYPDVVNPVHQSMEAPRRDYQSYIVPGQRERFEKSPDYLQAEKDLLEQRARLGQIRSEMLSPEEVRNRTIDEMNRVDKARRQLDLYPQAPGSWPYRRENETLKHHNRLLAEQDLARKELEKSQDYLGDTSTLDREMSAWAGLRDQDETALRNLFESQQVPELLRRPQLAPELTLREQEEQAYWENSELGQIKYDEGFEPKVYKDSVGIDTIGYGFNLERPEAQAELDHAGINKTVADLRSGKKSLTEAEADLLIRSEVPKFESAAMNFVGEETWNSLPKDKQNILTNMAFNLGSTRLNKFNNLRDALQAGDYEKAKDEMYKSTWREQVKSRATRLMDRMAAPDPYAMNPAPGYDIRNLFDDMGREDFDVESAIEDALRRRG